jgi:hypothetical protein
MLMLLQFQILVKIGGYNLFGQIGNGSKFDQKTFQKIFKITNLKNIKFKKIKIKLKFSKSQI